MGQAKEVFQDYPGNKWERYIPTPKCSTIANLI